MKLTVLADNNTYIDRYFLGEPAVCYLIEDGDKNILLDTGYSGVFMENAARMQIDLARVTDIVFSHGHNDHTGGLPAFAGRFSQHVRLFAHPNAFIPKRNRGMDVGSPLTIGSLPPQIELHLIGQPKQISDHAMYLGEIPRICSFESNRTIGESQSSCGCCWEPDKVSDDTALALALPDGVFVVTGCAHAGVCNTVRYAKAMTEKERVLGVLGGFHLFDPGEALDQTIETLKSLGVERVYPAHCTSLIVKSAFLRVFDTVEVGVGLTLEW